MCLIAVVWLALWYFIPAPPKSITVASGSKGGSFEHLALRYRERLARHHVKLIIRLTQNSVDSTRLIGDPKSGLDAAFLLGGVANSEELPGVVSLGRFAHSPIWIFYRSSETLDQLTQLKGKRVSIGPASGQTTTKIFAAYGVNAENTTFVTLNSPPAAQALRNGSLDVLTISQEISNPTIQSLLHDPMIRVMNVAQAEALTQLFPNLNRVVMPQGVINLEKNIPPSDVDLIAFTSVMVTRANLHPELIYLLAQTMKEEHSRGGVLQRPGEFPTQIDPEFPMAEEAVDFYKNGPSFLQRYLPFWMINYAKRVAAILVTAVAVVIPIVTYTPRLYAWLVRLRLLRLHRRLRLVNARLKGQLSIEQLSTLQGDLENIDRAANILPMRHSDSFLNLLMHIRFARTELERLRALQPVGWVRREAP